MVRVGRPLHSRVDQYAENAACGVWHEPKQHWQQTKAAPKKGTKRNALWIETSPSRRKDCNGQLAYGKLSPYSKEMSG